MQVKNDDDLHGGQRSSEVKCGNIMCHGYHIWSKELLMQVKMMMTFTEVKGHQRSNAETMCYGYQT